MPMGGLMGLCGEAWRGGVLDMYQKWGMGGNKQKECVCVRLPENTKTHDTNRTNYNSSTHICTRLDSLYQTKRRFPTFG